MSGFWRMQVKTLFQAWILRIFFIYQCAEDEFEITPQHYSFYLDPEERDKELKISWVWVLIVNKFNSLYLFQDTYVGAKEKCMKWLFDYSEHFAA